MTDSAGSSGRGADGPAHDQVVREDELRRQVVPQGRRVHLYEVRPLLPAEVLDAACLEVLVAVDDEDREDRADVGAHDARAAEVVALRMGILAEDDHLVALPGPRTRQRARVDIRPGASQEIAVPEQNLHRMVGLACWNARRGS